MTTTINEQGRVDVTCDEPECEQQLTDARVSQHDHTGDLIGPINAGWQIDVGDESKPDYCPKHRRP